MPGSIGFSEQAFTNFSGYLRRVFGLHFAPENRLHLEKALAPLIDELGINSYDQFGESLVSDPDNKAVSERLVQLLTIGETYFFREPAVLEAIGQYCARLAGGAAPCRIWSVGCCTGEEPYSLAMLLEDRGIHAYSILATDINNQFLEKANIGAYRQWSLRAIPRYFAAKYLVTGSDGVSVIDPVLRRRITFKNINLAEEMVLPAGSRREGFEVILCRNVLMYFNDALRDRVISDFYKALVPDGILAVGLTEITYVDRELFVPVYDGQSVLFRKRAVAGKPALFPNHGQEAGHRRQMPSVASLAATGGHQSVVTVLESLHVADGAASRDEYITAVRSAGNLGMREEGMRIATAGLLRFPDDCLLHFLIGQMKMEHADLSGALHAYAAAIISEPSFIAARFALASLRRAMGDSPGYVAELDAARRILEGIDASVLLPELDGMTAGTLLSVIQSLLREERLG